MYPGSCTNQPPGIDLQRYLKFKEKMHQYYACSIYPEIFEFLI